MLTCQICKKNRVYVCSDKKNAWCQSGCGNYAHFDGILFFLGKDVGQYPVREDGSIKKVKWKHEGNITITEEERLIDIENKFKELVSKKKEFDENYWSASNWWNDLSKEGKITIFQSNYDNNKEEVIRKDIQ